MLGFASLVKVACVLWVWRADLETFVLCMWEGKLWDQTTLNGVTCSSESLLPTHGRGGSCVPWGRGQLVCWGTVCHQFSQARLISVQGDQTCALPLHWEWRHNINLQSLGRLEVHFLKVHFKNEWKANIKADLCVWEGSSYRISFQKPSEVELEKKNQSFQRAPLFHPEETV